MVLIFWLYSFSVTIHQEFRKQMNESLEFDVAESIFLKLILLMFVQFV